MAKRNSAKSKYKKDPTDANLQRYKTLRNRYNKVCRDARRNYILSSIIYNNPAKTWKFLNVMGIDRRHTNIIASLKLLHGFKLAEQIFYHREFYR